MISAISNLFAHHFFRNTTVGIIQIQTSHKKKGTMVKSLKILKIASIKIKIVKMVYVDKRAKKKKMSRKQFKKHSNAINVRYNFKRRVA